MTPHDFIFASTSISCIHLVVLSWTIVYNNLWVSSGLSLSLGFLGIRITRCPSVYLVFCFLNACIGRFARYRFAY